jgi:putative hemolysin
LPDRPLLVNPESVPFLYAVGVVALLLVALLSAAEASFISANRVQVHNLARSGSRGAQLVENLLGNYDRLFGTLRLASTFLTILFALTVLLLGVYYFGWDAYTLAGLAAAAGIALLGQITPWRLAAAHAEAVAPVLAWFVWGLMVVAGWLTELFMQLPELLLRWGGKPVARRSPFLTEEELRLLLEIRGEQGAIETTEWRMVEKVFEFGDRQAYEVMIPRTDIVGVPRGMTVADFLRKVYARAPHAAYPVYEGNLDNIVGILHLKDVVMGLARDTISPGSPVDGLMREPYFVPETKNISELLAEMQERNQSVAVVVDEFGGTAGLITINELTSEIVGRLGDQLPQGEEGVKQIDERTIEVDGTMRLDELRDLVDVEFPEGEYDTVAGFILARLGRIPKVGDWVPFDHLRLVVSEMDGVKIERVRLVRADGAAGVAESQPGTATGPAA